MAANKLTKQKLKKKSKKRDKLVVSFDMDHEEEAEDERKVADHDNNDKTASRKKARFGMNPAVNTSFLPDREREAEERRAREQLRQTWLTRQEQLKGDNNCTKRHSQ